mgnify:CR=1 FL=1
MRAVAMMSFLALTATFTAIPSPHNAVAMAAAPAGLSVAFDPSLSRPDSPIGQPEMAEITQRIRETVSRRLEREQVAFTALNIWVVNLKPNRPTMTQIRLNPSLSYSSHGLGGAHFQAQMTLSNGRVVRVESQHFGHDIIQAQTFTTWTDADKAIDWLADDLVKASKSSV